jgi:hypothetical protein
MVAAIIDADFIAIGWRGFDSIVTSVPKPRVTADSHAKSGCA